MPIYEYYCDQCRKVFEKWTKHMEDEAEGACPSCASPSKRIMSNTSFVLKGGGWYVTDYGYRKGKDDNGSGKQNSSAKSAGSEAGDAVGASSPAPAAPAAPAQGELAAKVSEKTAGAPAA
jgi:putative FmdB family regulatory protein